jgi:hypothetical protein
MPFLTTDVEVCRKGRAWFSSSYIVEKQKIEDLDARRGRSSRELQNSKMKKAKVEFLVDEPKVAKVKH